MDNLYYILRHFTKVGYRIKGIGIGRLCEMMRRYAARNTPPKPFVIDDFQGYAKFNCYLREHMGGRFFSAAHILMIS